MKKLLFILLWIPSLILAQNVPAEQKVRELIDKKISNPGSRSKDYTAAEIRSTLNGLVDYVNLKAPAVSPELYGAKGDGKSNDFAALMLAFNSGQTVELLNTYAFRGKLTIPLSGATITGGNRKTRGTLKPMGNSQIEMLYDGNNAKITKYAQIRNLEVDLSLCTAPDFFNFDGIQHCDFSDLLFTGGATNPIRISNAYFNTFVRIHFENTTTGIRLYGTSFSNGCNFNELTNITLNNLTGTGIRLDFARGNSIENVDAEYGQVTGIGMAIHLQDSKHNVIRGVWYEAINATSPHDPAILITGLNSSNNTANLLEESGQILHKYTALRVTNSNNVTLQRLLFNNSFIAIEERGNTNLKIGHNLYETVTTPISLASNDTYIYDATNTSKRRINSQFTIDSDLAGTNGLIIKQAGNNRFTLLTDASGNTTLTVYDANNVAIPCGRWLSTGGFELRTWMQFFTAVSDGSVGNHTLFRDTYDQKLKYKDGSGIVQLLY